MGEPPHVHGGTDALRVSPFGAAEHRAPYRGWAIERNACAVKARAF